MAQGIKILLLKKEKCGPGEKAEHWQCVFAFNHRSLCRGELRLSFLPYETKGVPGCDSASAGNFQGPSPGWVKESLEGEVQESAFFEVPRWSWWAVRFRICWTGKRLRFLPAQKLDVPRNQTLWAPLSTVNRKCSKPINALGPPGYGFKDLKHCHAAWATWQDVTYHFACNFCGLVVWKFTHGSGPRQDSMVRINTSELWWMSSTPIQRPCLPSHTRCQQLTQGHSQRETWFSFLNTGQKVPIICQRSLGNKFNWHGFRPRHTNLAPHFWMSSFCKPEGLFLVLSGGSLCFFLMQTKDIRKHEEHMIARQCHSEKNMDFAFVMCDY
jgi:hypothetical protein